MLLNNQDSFPTVSRIITLSSFLPSLNFSVFDCMCLRNVGHGDQKRVSDTLELGLQVVESLINEYWDLNSGLLEKKSAF